MCVTFIPMHAMYLHARTFFTLPDTTSIPMGAMYLHARMFCIAIPRLTLSMDPACLRC